MVGLGKEIKSLAEANPVALCQQGLEVSRQGHRIAGNVKDTPRPDLEYQWQNLAGTGPRRIKQDLVEGSRCQDLCCGLLGIQGEKPGVSQIILTGVQHGLFHRGGVAFNSEKKRGFPGKGMKKLLG